MSLLREATMEQVMKGMPTEVRGAARARESAGIGFGWLSAIAPLGSLGLVRILYGVLWWQQSKWKVPSDDFGRKSGGGLWYWVHQEIQYPTVQAYKDFLVSVLIPNWTFFGWMTLVTETFIGA